MVEGRIQTRSWEGQDGQKKYRTEIIAESMQLGPKNIGSASPRAENQTHTEFNKSPEQLETVEYPEDDIRPEDIPF